MANGDKVICVVEGGVLQGVFASDPTLLVYVIDHDEEKVEELSPDETKRRKELVAECERLHEVEIRF